MDFFHKSVMLNECIDMLDIKSDGIYVDGTLKVSGNGHAYAKDITNGITLHGGMRGFCAGFFVFSDYMKGAMRLSALMKLPITRVVVSTQ